MKHLYKAQDNAMTYLIVRDMARDEDDAAVVNWDVSEDEIAEAVKAFEADENTTAFYADIPRWQPFDEIRERMNRVEHIA